MNGIYCSLLELDLTDVTGSVMRMTDAPFAVVYEGYEYKAFGALLAIDKITTENTLSSKELSITLSGISIDFQESINNNLFRRKSIVIKKAFVPEETNEVSEAKIYYRGLTSTPESMVDYNRGYLALKVSCKSIFDLDKTPSLMRCNNATHQAHHNGDKFFQYANQDLEEDVMWRKR
ncbi:hypothetical protein [Vibrio parahaemolyticus]|uniref:hypothetical protein n=1 Tax=Vibrio parahaemolyticus TaxID=670 RepID=UPI0005F1177B|nr:hypothetical protein [Vibrio parahaemolyticus]KJR15233.1 hypothetical protein UF28_16335 [Vibrio parahaemolyticus]